jgi:DNA-binding NarL/FixJ family response regulator
MSVRIVLADDHPLFLDALRCVLQCEPDMEVVGLARDGLSVQMLAQTLQPDVVCMDVNMPGVNGVDATRALRQQLPQVSIIGLSGHDDGHIRASMHTAGAVGYVVKSRAGTELVAAIRKALHHA